MRGRPVPPSAAMQEDTMPFETILDERRGQEYIARGLWANRTLMDVFDEHVARQPEKTVLVDAALD